MNYLSLFSGIGAFESAFRNLKIPFNLVGFSEIDEYAVKSYCAIHNVFESLNLGDITKIDEKTLPQVDFITYLSLRTSKKHKDLPIDAKIERVSNTQLYKQAGNSIVVDVAEELLCMLFDENGELFI